MARLAVAALANAHRVTVHEQAAPPRGPFASIMVSSDGGILVGYNRDVFNVGQN
jgi:hypothetical protein